MQKLSILLVEDNITIAAQLTEFLEGHGWQVDYASRGGQGIQLALSHVYDLVILDLTLPDIDGLSVCKAIKAQAAVNLPVLMLTARDAFEAKAEGYDCGADDYVTKPFDLRELALRCQALAKRNQLHQQKIIKVGTLVMNQSQHTVMREEKPLTLTNIGFKLLYTLAEAYPQAVSRSSLIQQVWQGDPPNSDALRTHIYSLRNALDKPFNKAMLITITNVGYKLVTDREI